MPYVYCVLCGNRDKSVSYHKFPKKEELRKQWLAFCGIDEHVLNTGTKLCSNHFREEDLIKKARKGAFTKPNAMPSIRKKKRKTPQQPNSSISKVHCGIKEKYIVTDNVNVDSKISIEDTLVVVGSQFISPSVESAQSSNYQTPPKTESYIIETPDLVIKTEIPFEIANDGLPTLLKDEDTQRLNYQTPLKAVPESCAGIIGTSDLTIKTEKPFEIANDGLPIPLRGEGTQWSNCQTSSKTVSEPCFDGAIKTPRLVAPRTARTLESAKQTIKQQRRKIKTLQQARNRLLARITTMKALVENLKQRNLVLEKAADQKEKQSNLVLEKTADRKKTRADFCLKNV